MRVNNGLFIKKSCAFEPCVSQLFNLLKKSHLKANLENSHFYKVKGKKLEIASINRIHLAASSLKNLLGVTIYSELKLENPLQNYVWKFEENLGLLVFSVPWPSIFSPLWPLTQFSAAYLPWTLLFSPWSMISWHYFKSFQFICRAFVASL